MGWRLCWNVASQRLPTVILGPLIVSKRWQVCCTPFYSASKCRRNDAERYRAVSDWRGHCGQSKPEKPLTESVSES